MGDVGGLGGELSNDNTRRAIADVIGDLNRSDIGAENK